MQPNYQKKQPKKNFKIVFQQVNPSLPPPSIHQSSSLQHPISIKKQKTQVPKQYIHFIQLKKQMIDTLQKMCLDIDKRIQLVQQKYIQHLFKSIMKQIQIQKIHNNITKIQLIETISKPYLILSYNYHSLKEQNIKKVISHFTQQNYFIRETISSFFRRLLDQKNILSQKLHQLQKIDQNSPNFPKCLKQILLKGVQKIESTSKELEQILKRYPILKTVLEGKLKIVFQNQR